MKCDECGSRDTEFNERLGEHCCLDCGLVIVTEIFEETVRLVSDGEFVRSSDKGRLGSVISGQGSHHFNKWGKSSVYSKAVQDGLIHCNMVLASVAPQMNLSQRVEELYIKLLNSHVFGQTRHEVRATAVVYFVLLENGTEHTIKEVSAEFPDSAKSAKKLIRKIKQLIGVQNLAYNPVYRLEKTVSTITDCLIYMDRCRKTFEYFETLLINSDYTKSPAHYASICWITANHMLHPTITRRLIAEKLGMSEHKIWRETKKLLNLIGFQKPQEIRGKKLW